MKIIQIIEIVISLILFAIIINILISKKTNYKIITCVIAINLLVIIHLGYSNIQIHLNEGQVVDKQVSAYEVLQKEIINKDTTPPIIVLKGKTQINLKKGETYQEEGFSAIDEKDGSLVRKVIVTKKKISDTQYKIIYSVEDSAGNKASAERTINTEKSQTDNKNNNIKNNNTTTNQEVTEKKKKKNTTGIIYLTFDDGPSNSSTPKILDILKEENVKATFFILNYNESTVALVKREVTEGHSVGIHGYSHDYKKIYKSVDSYMENLNKLQDKIYKTTGIKTTLTRFPGGSSNTISKFNKGIMTKLTKEIGKQGYKYCDWNVDSGDATNPKNSEKVYKNVVEGLYPDKENIVLLHDFSGNQKTIDALKKIIKYGKENNYTFKAITTDTKMVHHGILN